MAHRDGDGWVQCTCGSKHWGLHGAAGLLLVQNRKVLLQHRAPWVHNGDTWGIPGVARDSHETVIEAAAREAHEEVGIAIDAFTPITTHTVEHDLWQYNTVIAHAHENITTHEMNEESIEVRWVAIESVDEMNLHPSFERAWPELKTLLFESGI
jgi:8-oxo-dGTP diphosphatase